MSPGRHLGSGSVTRAPCLQPPVPAGQQQRQDQEAVGEGVSLRPHVHMPQSSHGPCSGACLVPQAQMSQMSQLPVSVLAHTHHVGAKNPAVHAVPRGAAAGPSLPPFLPLMHGLMGPPRSRQARSPLAGRWHRQGQLR